ncbi:MAG: hypothetical protein IMZ71_03260 [Chloroflexi bacterium]|nr:hypothetical protein [Chloroflexota bacterium]
MNHWSMMKNVTIEPGRGDEMTGMRVVAAAPTEEWDAHIPDSEVREPQPRPLRRFTARYKADLLRQAESCSSPGELAALLRREGLYSSHLHRWRQQEQQALEEALFPKPRGRKANPDGSLLEENRKLSRKVSQLETRLKQLQTLIEVQKKISELLEIPLSVTKPSEGD